MLYPGPARLCSTDALVDLLTETSVGIARELRKRTKAKPPRRGATLRPGVETPHWLALVAAVQPHLRIRGTKAQLARELGLHRGRISQFFQARTAMPDAERTLLLMQWLLQRSERAEQ